MPSATRHRSERRSPERALHIAVEQFLRVAWPPHLPYTHFPAGELRDRAAAGKLKAMGLKPGWPDFQFILPNGQAAFIELKADGGALSEEQLDVSRRLVALNCGFATCRSVDDVEKKLTAWLSLFGLALRARSLRSGVIARPIPKPPEAA